MALSQKTSHSIFLVLLKMFLLEKDLWGLARSSNFVKSFKKVKWRKLCYLNLSLMWPFFTDEFFFSSKLHKNANFMRFYFSPREKILGKDAYPRALPFIWLLSQDETFKLLPSLIKIKSAESPIYTSSIHFNLAEESFSNKNQFFKRKKKSEFKKKSWKIFLQNLFTGRMGRQFKPGMWKRP